MRNKHGGLEVAAVALAFSLTGCLAPFDPMGGAGGTGGAGSSAGATGGTGGVAGAGGAGGGMLASGPDLATPLDGGSGGSDLASSSTGDLATVCDNLQSTASLSSPSGHHNAGAECQGCHAPGGGAPTFYVGGTLYSAASGGAAVAGATINVTDANGQKLKIITAANGNFWTSTVLAYPITVDASLCPNTQPMVATVGANGACNNCHNSTFRVHLP